jgi:hypothetical protein
MNSTGIGVMLCSHEYLYPKLQKYELDCLWLIAKQEELIVACNLLMHAERVRFPKVIQPIKKGEVICQVS